jgi:ferric-dicitrate binding protein FerR (iron transport regulator)
MEWLIWLQASPEDQELRAACEAWQRASPGNASAWQRAEQVWRLAGQLPPGDKRQWSRGKKVGAQIVAAIFSCVARRT